MSLEELYEENEKLRADLAWSRDECAAERRAKEDTEANLRSTQALYEAEQTDLRVAREDVEKHVQRVTQVTKDNTAFHSENVEVRVGRDELMRERTEREVMLRKVTAERDAYKTALDKLQDAYDDLQTRLTFAVSEHSLHASPTRVMDAKGGTLGLQQYLRKVAEDHPLAQAGLPVPVDNPYASREAIGNAYRLGPMAAPLMATRPLGEATSVLRPDVPQARNYGLDAYNYAYNPFAPSPPKLTTDMLGSYARLDMQTKR